MAKIVNIFSSMDEDMKDYHKKIWKHRAIVVLKYVGIVLLVLAAIFGFRYYLNNRNFSAYQVRKV